MPSPHRRGRFDSRSMSNICVVGTGYVGLVTGTCFAEMGHRVCCVDIDEAKIDGLRRGVMPIYEPGLQDLVVRNSANKRLSFNTSYQVGAGNADFIFITVGTPPDQDGSADLRQVQLVAFQIANNMRQGSIIVNKSTVPVGTAEWITLCIKENMKSPIPFAVASNPEFLREGSAVSDFFSPSRVVVGSTSRQAAELVADLYAPLRRPILITDSRTSEMIKYASNAFLATKISFINEIAHICEMVGADVCQVANGMGLDYRIGRAFLDAGLGYGGSCFPKDVKALAQLAEGNGFHPQLLNTVMAINQDQCALVIKKLQSVLYSLEGKTLGVLGLAFKPNTDDIREAPALRLIALLRAHGAHVKAYDPVAMSNVQRVMPEELQICSDPYQVAKDSDALVIATEWEEFKQLDFARIHSDMAYPLLIDGRNMLDVDEMHQLGFTYFGIGKGTFCRSALFKEAGGNGDVRPPMIIQGLIDSFRDMVPAINISPEGRKAT